MSLKSDMFSTETQCLTDRMYVYLWEDTTDIGVCKFGERWVFAGKDPLKDCNTRIRESLNVQKWKYDEGHIRTIGIWDVTDLAKKVGRYYKGARMDDYIREYLGHRKGAQTEAHNLSGDEMYIKVNKVLTNLGQPLTEVRLSTTQYQVAEEIITKFKNDETIILAELCARFGKTLWSGAVAKEMDVDLVIVASYVTTAFTSFQGDITSFSQFSSYEHVDTSDVDYQQQINEVLKSGKKVFAYLSLNSSTQRQERIDFLFSKRNSKMLIVDEGDFGAHQPKQAEPLVKGIDKLDYVIIMTGTNADRAATFWPIDSMISVTYPELLIQKKSVKNA